MKTWVFYICKYGISHKSYSLSYVPYCLFTAAVGTMIQVVCL